MRIAETIFERTPRVAIPALIDLLGSEDFGSRNSAGLLLEKLTGAKVPPLYAYEDQDKVQEGVRLWQTWWRENESRYRDGR
ncbi:MAG: hypothetical protein HY720_30055 [Planctomycetes bacterium]|nr:hypothetical protein [Planctomycetota bacterium]